MREQSISLSKIKKISKFTFKQANSLFLLSWCTWFWPLSTKTCSKNNIHSLTQMESITARSIMCSDHFIIFPFWASRWILCHYIFITATAQIWLWSLMCRCRQNKGVSREKLAIQLDLIPNWSHNKERPPVRTCFIINFPKAFYCLWCSVC